MTNENLGAYYVYQRGDCKYLLHMYKNHYKFSAIARFVHVIIGYKELITMNDQKPLLTCGKPSKITDGLEQNCEKQKKKFGPFQVYLPILLVDI